MSQDQCGIVSTVGSRFYGKPPALGHEQSQAK
ncbi:hypothetical protein BJ928_104229 [Rhizobium sp. WW_1]|jgi:hypothetical protein|nr:hypothetical protein BJ928_104229 [Rhizobium sp. WW_1]